MLGLYAEMIQRAQDPGNDGIVGPRWRRWFTLVCLAATKLLGSEATLVSVAAIAADMDRVRALGREIAKLDPELSHRLISEYGALSGKEATDLSSWAVSKLQELLAAEQVRWIFGAGPDAVDVRAAMDEGTSLFVDLGAHTLGEPAGRAIGATYLLKHWAALAERRDRSRTHVVIVDEAHLFSYGPLPKLLAEARKFGVGVVVASQDLGQLTGELAHGLETNTGTFISLRAGLRSAQRASARLEDWPATELVRLPDLMAAATLSHGGMQTAPFTLHVDHHARVRRLAERGLVGGFVAEQVEERSRARALPFQGLTPLSDVELAARLAPRRSGASPRDEAPVARPPSLLDEWLAKRTAGDGVSVDPTD